jgi:hypothetical protein
MNKQKVKSSGRDSACRSERGRKCGSPLLLDWTLISRSIQVSQIAPWNRLPLSHCDIDDILLKWQKQVANKKGVKRSVPGLSFMEKEQEKITLRPNIYRKENNQHEIENQRLSSHLFYTLGVTDPVRSQQLLCSNVDPLTRRETADSDNPTRYFMAAESLEDEIHE